MNYSDYMMNKKERVMACGQYLILCILISFFFYRSYIAFFIFLPGVFFYNSFYKKRLLIKRKKQLSIEFVQTLYSVSSGIKAGLSVENAFMEAGEEMLLFYGDSSLMAMEIKAIKSGLRLNISIEELLEDLGARSNDEDIILFSEVLRCAKRNGGNIREVLSETADRIQERIYIDNEINLLISEKKLELRIMEVVPFFILIYLDITSRGYFDILYGNIRGTVVMTICLFAYLAAVLIAEAIMGITV